MNQSFLNELLSAMCKHYEETYGGFASKLDSWNFNYVECTTIPRLRAVVDKYEAQSDNDNLVTDTFKELVLLGYLEERDWGFCLSEAGLQHGKQSVFRKFVVYLNQNPGWALPLSAAALVVAMLSLYVAYTKP